MDTRDKLRQFMVEELQTPNDALESDSPLITSHIIDSLGMLQIVSFVESEFEVEIADDELVPTNFDSISAIAQLVESKVAERAK